MPSSFDFYRFPLWINGLAFLLTTAVVWLAGTRLTNRVELIAEQTGVGRAFIGLVLIGGVVSLPELSTSVAAALDGNARFAANTLLGGIAVTMVAIAVVDAVVRERPISTDITNPVVLLQGALSVLFLLVAAGGITVGDIGFAGGGLWTSGLLVLYLCFAQMVRGYQRNWKWTAEEEWTPETVEEEAEAAHERRKLRRNPQSLSRLILVTAALAAATATAGILLSRIGEALAEQTGLGSSYAGFVLGGVVTTMPEVSSIFAAIRIRRFELVFSAAYGSNLFSTMAIFFADLAYPGGPILNEVGRFGLFGVLIGAAVCGIFLAGCVERTNRAILGMGIDSLVVLCTYIGGMVLLFHMR